MDLLGHLLFDSDFDFREDILLLSVCFWPIPAPDPDVYSEAGNDPKQTFTDCQFMGPTFYEIELIGSGFLAVMAKPVPGEWIDDEFSGLHQAGLRQVVSLLEDHEAHELGLSEEKELCEKHGLSFVSYPIPDRGLPPTVEGFKELTKSVYHESAGGSSTVVHCRAGIGRTGLVAAGVLLHAAFGVEEAFDHITKRRGVEVPDTQEQRDWLLANYDEIVKQKDTYDS